MLQTTLQEVSFSKNPEIKMNLFLFRKAVISCDIQISNHFSFCRYEKFEGKQFSLSDAEYFVFHSPYNKVDYFNVFITIF